MLHIPGQGPSAKLYQADMLNFMFNKYITIEVRDSQTDTLLFQTQKAMITRRSETLNAENIATMTLQWKAIGFLDERVPNLGDNFIESIRWDPGEVSNQKTRNSAPDRTSNSALDDEINALEQAILE
jgi:hypothetical protein